MPSLNALFLFVLILGLSPLGLSCATTQAATTKSEKPAPLLNSERIKQKFGSYGVRVLDSTIPNLRISSLYSLHDGNEVCRTFAVTQFEEKLDPLLEEGHRGVVVENQSIGATFKDLGWALTKDQLYIGVFEPHSTCLFQLMGHHLPQPLAVNIYKLSLSKGDSKNLPYAIIAEIHHPDYLSLDELQSIFKDVHSIGELDRTWFFITSALRNLKC
jgi:hypothetical protein